MQTVAIPPISTMRSVLIVLLGMGLVAAGRPGAAATQERDTTAPALPPYRLLRQEEDWSSLRGRERAEELLVPKCQSLLEAASAFLTLGGEVRTMTHWYRNEQWGEIPGADGYVLQRLMLHGAITTEVVDGMQLRGFVQLKSGLVVERDGPVSPPDKDLLGLNQAFVGLSRSLGQDRALTLRLGRQELHYGAGRMIAVREGPNVRLGYDAILGRYAAREWHVDVFIMKPNATSSGVLDNGWMPGRTLWGAYLQRRAAAGVAVDAYYLGTRRNPSPVNRSSRAVRHTVGARGSGAVGPLTYDGEAALQFGRERRVAPTETVDHAPIRAWMLAGHLTYRASDLAGQPSIGLLMDLSSGDDSDTKANETFAAPYPSGRFTGAGSRLGPGNLMNLRPELGIRLGSDLRTRLTTHFFWRLQATDGVYAIWGAPLRSGSEDRARLIGLMPEGFLTWDANRHLDLSLEASYFMAGPMLREHPPARNATHLGLRAKYVF